MDCDADDRMNFVTFYNSVFELIDHWTMSTKQDEYVLFCNVLGDRITDAPPQPVNLSAEEMAELRRKAADSGIDVGVWVAAYQRRLKSLQDVTHCPELAGGSLRVRGKLEDDATVLEDPEDNAGGLSLFVSRVWKMFAEDPKLRPKPQSLRWLLKEIKCVFDERIRTNSRVPLQHFLKEYISQDCIVAVAKRKLVVLVSTIMEYSTLNAEVNMFSRFVRNVWQLPVLNALQRFDVALELSSATDGFSYVVPEFDLDDSPHFISYAVCRDVCRRLFSDWQADEDERNMYNELIDKNHLFDKEGSRPPPLVCSKLKAAIRNRPVAASPLKDTAVSAPSRSSTPPPEEASPADEDRAADPLRDSAVDAQALRNEDAVIGASGLKLRRSHFLHFVCSTLLPRHQLVPLMPGMSLSQERERVRKERTRLNSVTHRISAGLKFIRVAGGAKNVSASADEKDTASPPAAAPSAKSVELPREEAPRISLARRRLQDALRLERPSVSELSDRNIIPASGGHLSPKIASISQSLTRKRLADSISGALKRRPSLDDLVAKGIISSPTESELMESPPSAAQHADEKAEEEDPDDVWIDDEEEAEFEELLRKDEGGSVQKRSPSPLPIPVARQQGFNDPVISLAPDVLSPGPDDSPPPFLYRPTWPIPQNGAAEPGSMKETKKEGRVSPIPAPTKQLAVPQLQISAIAMNRVSPPSKPSISPLKGAGVYQGKSVGNQARTSPQPRIELSPPSSGKTSTAPNPSTGMKASRLTPPRVDEAGHHVRFAPELKVEVKRVSPLRDTSGPTYLFGSREEQVTTKSVSAVPAEVFTPVGAAPLFLSAPLVLSQKAGPQQRSRSAGREEGMRMSGEEKIFRGDEVLELVGKPQYSARSGWTFNAAESNDEHLPSVRPARVGTPVEREPTVRRSQEDRFVRATYVDPIVKEHAGLLFSTKGLHHDNDPLGGVRMKFTSRMGTGPAAEDIKKRPETAASLKQSLAKSASRVLSSMAQRSEVTGGIGLQVVRPATAVLDKKNRSPLHT